MEQLDYVSGWFFKAADYGNQTKCAAAFVATNSICQGAHVPLLWPLVEKLDHEIFFAHTSFNWANLATHNAGVTVVIVGIAKRGDRSKIIFSETDDQGAVSRDVAEINAYLLPAPQVYVDSVRAPRNG